MKIVSIAVLSGALGWTIVDPASAADTTKFKEQVLYSFCAQANCADGSRPSASLIDVKKTFYTTTQEGGSNNGGTVFALDPKTGAEEVVYSFCSQQNCADGQQPNDGVIDVKGTLYGTTYAGGAYCQFRGGNGPCGTGTVFAVDPGKDAETVVYSFGGNADDGVNPSASFVSLGGMLYGTAPYGGAHEQGVAYEIDRKTGAEAVLYSFCSLQNCADGSFSLNGLTAANGTLYGVTVSGGLSTGPCGAGCGTVYSLDPKTGTETVLYAFCQQQNCTDGLTPNASLITVNGTLYGTTMAGGTYGLGTVFALNLGTGAETVLHSFSGGSDGTYPEASLIDVNGILYGTTPNGGGTGCGGAGCGTVFAVDENAGTEQVTYAFCAQPNCVDGEAPFASLTEVKGALYGTTLLGGKNGYGTVFALRKK